MFMKFFEKLGVEKENQNLLAIIYFIYWTSGMTGTLCGAVLPHLQKAYDLNYIFMGTLGSFHQIGNLIAGLVAGILPYYMGRKKSFSILYFIMMLGVLFISGFSSPLLLLIGFLFTGIGRGACGNVTNVVVMQSTKDKTAGLNILHTCFAVGAFTAPFLLLGISSKIDGYGWRIALWILAAAMFTGFILLQKSSLSKEKIISKKRKSGTGENAENLPPFYKSLNYWLVVAILFFYLAEETGTMNWMIPYFRTTGLMSESLAQSTTSLLWITIMIGRLSLAFLSPKIKNKNLLIVSIGAANLAAFLLMIFATSTPLMIAGIFLSGIFMAGIYPTTLSTMHPEYNTDSTAVGVTLAVTIGGGILMPSIVGVIAEKFGMAIGFYTFTVPLALMVILMAVKVYFDKRQKTSISVQFTQK